MKIGQTRRLVVAQRMNAQLKESNAALARTLNAALIDNRRLTEELSEARMELADQKQNREAIQWHINYFGPFF